jgi:hypothetical protein
VIPANPADAAGMVAQGMAVFNHLSSKGKTQSIPLSKSPEKNTEPNSLDEIL